MAVRSNPFTFELRRGVWDAPFLSRDGETVILVIGHDRRRLAEVIVKDPRDESSIRALCQAELDREDPVRELPVISALLRV